MNAKGRQTESFVSCSYVFRHAMLKRLLTILVAMASMADTRYIMYLTGSVSSISLLLCALNSWYSRQHDVVPPDKSLVADITHVALAFMSPAIFNEERPRSSWPLFKTVEKARSRFAKETAIMVAVGGWGDTAGFEIAAATGDARRLFARNVKVMVDATGADGWPNGFECGNDMLMIVSGVDIDWEYPGSVTTLISLSLHLCMILCWQLVHY